MRGKNPPPFRDAAMVAAIRVLLLAVASALLTGCFDTKEEITLNPDGSGKVLIESTFTPLTLFQTLNPEQRVEGLTNTIRQLFEKSEGVDAWRDVSFRQLDDGRIFIRGTAYFPDLSKFKMGARLLGEFSVGTDAVGNMIISSHSARSASPYPLQKTNEPVTAESIQRERAQFRAALPMLQATAGEMKLDAIIHVPGTIRRASNFQTVNSNTLRLRFDGKKRLEAAESVVFETSLDEKRIAGEKLTASENNLNEILFGQNGPVLAVIKPQGTPLFDYAKEVAEAQRLFPEFARQLRPESPPQEPPKPAVDGQPAILKAIGIEWFGEDSPTQRYRPSGNWRRGYKIHLKAELSGNVQRVDKVLFTRAVTLEGLDLLLPYQNSNSTASPSTSKDGSSVAFQANLLAPPADSQGITEVSGVLECAGMSSNRTVELISGRLRAGTKGTEFDTQIDSFDPRMSGMDRLSIRTRLKPDQIRSIRVMGDAGQLSNLEQRGHTILGDIHVITYVSRIQIPHTGKIVADVLTGEQTLRIPFALTNVTLLGQPLP